MNYKYEFAGIKNQTFFIETPINEHKPVLSKNISVQNCSILFIKALLIMLLVFINIYIILIFISKNNSLFQKEKKKENDANFININISKINNSLLNLNNKEKDNIINILTINSDITTNKNITIQNNNISALNNSKELPNNYSTSNYYKSEEEKMKAYNKGRVYFESCLEDQLINNKTFIKSENPFISVVIPVYNSEKRIKYSIRSIQNQNITNLEIILVNDFSNDRTNQVIKQMEINDPRIVSINNAKNMGTLYSRCIGTLEAKGKYILTLDNDDLFMDENVLDIVMAEAEQGGYDIVEFNAVRGYSYIPHILDMIDDIYHDNPNNLVLHQPELGFHSIIKNGKFESNSIHIWGKCLKSSIYKKAVNIIGKKRYSHYMTWAEDTSVVFLLFNIAESFKFISKYGVFHLMSTKTACYTESIENILFGELYLLDIMYDFSKNNYEAKKYIKLKALEIRQLSFFNTAINKKSNKEYLKNILKKIINCKYINLEDKRIIINNFSDFI